MAKLFIQSPQTELCTSAIYFTTCKDFFKRDDSMVIANFARQESAEHYK